MVYIALKSEYPTVFSPEDALRCVHGMSTEMSITMNSSWGSALEISVEVDAVSITYNAYRRGVPISITNRIPRQEYSDFVREGYRLLNVYPIKL